MNNKLNPATMVSPTFRQVQLRRQLQAQRECASQSGVSLEKYSAMDPQDRMVFSSTMQICADMKIHAEDARREEFYKGPQAEKLRRAVEALLME